MPGKTHNLHVQIPPHLGRLLPCGSLHSHLPSCSPFPFRSWLGLVHLSTLEPSGPSSAALIRRLHTRRPSVPRARRALSRSSCLSPDCHVSSRPAVELDHGRSDYRLPCPRATASTTELLETYFHADPQPSPAPDSGNLHPVRCIIPQPSLLPPAPVPGDHISKSPLELTARPSTRRPPLWPRRQQKPQKPRNCCRDKGRQKASIPRSPTTTAIPRAQQLLTTRQHLGSWTIPICLLTALAGSPRQASDHRPCDCLERRG